MYINQLRILGEYQPHNAPTNNTGVLWAEGTVLLGEGRAYKFFCKDRLKISVCEGPMLQEFGQLHYVLSKTCPRRTVSVVSEHSVVPPFQH